MWWLFLAVNLTIARMNYNPQNYNNICDPDFETGKHRPLIQILRHTYSMGHTAGGLYKDNVPASTFADPYPFRIPEYAEDQLKHPTSWDWASPRFLNFHSELATVQLVVLQPVSYSNTFHICVCKLYIFHKFCARKPWLIHLYIFSFSLFPSPWLDVLDRSFGIRLNKNGNIRHIFLYLCSQLILISSGLWVNKPFWVYFYHRNSNNILSFKYWNVNLGSIDE